MPLQPHLIYPSVKTAKEPPQRLMAAKMHAAGRHLVEAPLRVGADEAWVMPRAHARACGGAARARSGAQGELRWRYGFRAVDPSSLLAELVAWANAIAM